MLSVEAIETAYGPSQVLFGVSLAVEPGEVVTLLGRNGMGKTTTVRSIMGIVPLRAGRIRFEGRALQGLPAYRVAQAGLGLVPEGRQIFTNLTVRENLLATAANRLAKPGPVDRRAGFRHSSRTWPSAALTWAVNSRAASSRCWRWAGR